MGRALRVTGMSTPRAPALSPQRSCNISNAPPGRSPPPTVQRGAVDASGQLTPDGRGYFGWNPQLKLYFEIISYEKLVGDALRRNRMLFRKLGLPDRPRGRMKLFTG